MKKRTPPGTDGESGQTIVELALGLFFITLFLMIGFYIAGFSMVNINNLISARSEAENNAWADSSRLSVDVDDAFTDKLAAITSTLKSNQLTSSGGVSLGLAEGNGDIDTHLDDILTLGSLASWFGLKDRPISDLVKDQRNQIYFPLLHNTDE